MTDATNPTMGGETPCLMCGDSRQVPDAKSWKYYPEDRPCPRCTDGTWEHADRLVAERVAAITKATGG